MEVGWRARIGVILPSLNVATEPEFYRVIPDGVTVHAVRMGWAGYSRENYEGMLGEVRTGVRYLGHTHANAIAFACTSGSLFGGPGYDQQIIALMGEGYTRPCTTTSTAVAAALREMGMRRVAVVTPYPDWVNELVKAFLEAHEIAVPEIRGLITPGGVPGITRGHAVPFVRSLATLAEVDGVFLSCTGMPTLGYLDQLEQDLGKPVVSSNQATMWQTLALAGIGEVVPGWGELLRRPRGVGLG